jgi:hypothetical protein
MELLSKLSSQPSGVRLALKRTTPGVACAPPGAELLPALGLALLHAGGVRGW